VYDIEKPKGVSKGILNSTYGSVDTGKSSYKTTVQKARQHGKTQVYGHAIKWAWVDDLAPLFDPAYDVRWLKPKQTTVLRLQGHRVEPAEPGDKVGHVGPIKTPVRLGR
jgi:hypothetical protein